MAFDPKSAKPVEEAPQSKPKAAPKGFDLSTAKPIEEAPEATNQNQYAQIGQEAFQETNRGMLTGLSRIAGSLDSLTRIVQQTTGAPRGGGFEDASKYIKNVADSIPDPEKIDGSSKVMYNIIGEGVAAVPEFTSARGVVNTLKFPQLASRSLGKIPAIEALSDAAALGVAQAVNEFKSNNPGKSLGEGFATGATFGLAVPSAITLGKSLGRGAAYQFVKFVTGDELLARDFAANPLKYKLFGKVKAADQVTKENEKTLQDLQSAYNEKVAAEKIAISEKKAQFNDEQAREFSSLQAAHRNVLNSRKAATTADVEAIAKSQSESYSRLVASTKDDLLDDFTNFTKKLDDTRQQYGQEVEQAVDNLLSKDPFATARTENIMHRFAKVADDFGFQVNTQGGKVNPYTGWEAPMGEVVPKSGFSAADDSVRVALQENLNDILSVAGERGIPVGFLQDRKRFLQQAYDGAPSAANNVKKILARQLDPAGMNETVFLGRDIAPELDRLYATNKKFSRLIPRYEEAIKNYTKLDAQGNPIPDFTKVLNAVKRGDKAAIKQFRKADMALPEEDRILPKVEEAVKKLNRADTEMKASIQLAKRKAKEAMHNLNTMIKEKEFQLKRAQETNKTELARRFETELFNLKQTEKLKLQEIERKLKEDETFLHGQESLRKFFGAGRAGNLQTAGVLQNLGLVTAGSAAFGGPNAALRAAGGVGLALGGSPILGASAAQGGYKTLRVLTDLVERTYRPVGIATQKSREDKSR